MAIERTAGELRRLVVDHDERRVFRREQVVGQRIADRRAGHQECTWEW